MVSVSVAPVKLPAPKERDKVTAVFKATIWFWPRLSCERTVMLKGVLMIGLVGVTVVITNLSGGFSVCPIPVTNNCCVIAPVLVNAITPGSSPITRGVNRMSMVVTGTEPFTGVNVIELVENAFAPIRISYPLGGVIIIGSVNDEPFTLNDLPGDERPRLILPKSLLKPIEFRVITALLTGANAKPRNILLADEVASVVAAAVADESTTLTILLRDPSAVVA